MSERAKSMLVVAGAALVALLMISGSYVAMAASSRPDLSGKWKLNAKKSDNPRDAMRKGMGGRQHGGSGGFGRMGRQGGMGGGVGNGGMRGSGGPGAGRGPGGPAGDQSIEIRQADGSVTFIHRNGREETIPTDGSTVEVDGPRGDRMTVRARWEEDALVVIRSSPMRTITERWSLADDGQLQVEATLGGDTSTDNVQFKRIFDPQP